jgi:hypothetical protein
MAGLRRYLLQKTSMTDGSPLGRRFPGGRSSDPYRSSQVVVADRPPGGAVEIVELAVLERAWSAIVPGRGRLIMFVSSSQPVIDRDRGSGVALGLDLIGHGQ